jgi:hypothetical protein
MFWGSLIPHAGPDMGFALGGLICVCAGLAGGVLGLAALLKLAVVLANRTVGPVAEKEKPLSRGGIAEWDWDDWDDEDEHDNSRPFAQSREWKPAIPEPSVLKSAGIVAVTAFATVLGFVLLSFAAEGMGLRPGRDETQFALAVVELPVVGFILSALLSALLPTGFWRAAMITFLYGLLLFALAVFFGMAIFVLRAFL